MKHCRSVETKSESVSCRPNNSMDSNDIIETTLL
nr:MAG TPA: hypothetical protein [Caudoviricetes sp.]